MNVLELYLLITSLIGTGYYWNYSVKDIDQGWILLLICIFFSPITIPIIIGQTLSKIKS